MSDYIQDKPIGDVVITKEEYASLLKAKDKLACLEAGGVDNWDFYSDALREGGYFTIYED